MRGEAMAIVFLALVGSEVSAAEWWLTSGATDEAIFVDAGSLERSGNTVRFWEYVIHREPVLGAKSSKRQKVVDCRTMGARLLQVIDYDVSDMPGVPLNYTKATRGFEVATDPLTASAYRFACDDPTARTATGATLAQVPEAIADRVFTQVAYPTP